MENAAYYAVSCLPRSSTPARSMMLLRFLYPACALLATAHAEQKPPCFLPVKGAEKLHPSPIVEASGLAISSVNPSFMWLVNDSGGAPDIYLTHTDGTYRGKVTVKGTTNIDWEDLASFSLDGKNYLLVADTGDNSSRRDSCTLYILREPTIPEPAKNLATTVIPAWQIQFRYEDGPRDCEAVGVDAKAGKIILISKRTHPPQIYELPLHPSKKHSIQTARKIGQMTVNCPILSLIPFRDQPVGLAINADHSLAAVVTYYSIFLFPRQPTESWAVALSHPPTILPPHSLGQAESVAFSKDGKTLYTVAEGNESLIKRYEKKPVLSN